MSRQNSFDDDAQLARDMQLAYDMQAQETQAHQIERDQQQEMARFAQLQLDEQLRQQEQQRQQQQTHNNHHYDYPATRSRPSPTAAASASASAGRSQPPVVQGRNIRPSRSSSSARAGSATQVRSAAPTAAASGAKQAVTTDGFTQQQNQNLIYVPAAINDRPVEVMVDTGAQSSVISAQLMHKLGLHGKLNTRMQGTAQGVGRASILGIVEHCPAQIGHVEFLLYFLVLDVPHDMIIMGIDQMRRFKCVVDLEDEKLIFGGKDGVQVSFLPAEKQWLNARNQAVNDNCSIS